MALLISACFLLSGCGYKFVAGGQPKITVKPVLNYSLQPLADICLSEAVKKVFVEYPDFSLVNSEAAADYVLHLKINRWKRKPVFFSRKDSKDIAIAGFETETEISLFKNGENIFTETVKETFSASLAEEYREDYVLEKISQKLAEKIYFRVLDKR
ncbi:MAG: hypothetical protein JW957_07810 [Candidatus Omnitrophica bacterium]|nr:hypothetical protein [Candidatus Omnitrophota bacterium]